MEEDNKSRHLTAISALGLLWLRQFSKLSLLDYAAGELSVVPHQQFAMRLWKVR